jgi:hypothetical protein
LAREDGQVKNPAGEAVLLSLAEARFERKIILPQDVEKYGAEEKIRALETIIRGIKQAAGANLAGRVYLQDLSRRIGRLKEHSDQNKIVPRS